MSWLRISDLVFAGVFADLVGSQLAALNFYLVRFAAVARCVDVCFSIRAATVDSTLAGHMELLFLGIIRQYADNLGCRITQMTRALCADDGESDRVGCVTRRGLRLPE